MVLVFLAALGLAISLVGFSVVNDDVVLIGLCILLGLDVKLLDQLIDDREMKRFRPFAFPLALVIPILMGYLAIIHDPVFGMVMGTALGLLVSGKLDHPAFIIAALGFLVGMAAFIVLFTIEIAMTSIYLIPLAAFGAFGDEFGHEKVSKGNHPPVVVHFFQHRFLLKIVALVSVIIGFADLIHLLAFLCWDASYDLVALGWSYSEKIK